MKSIKTDGNFKFISKDISKEKSFPTCILKNIGKIEYLEKYHEIKKEEIARPEVEEHDEIDNCKLL